MCFTQIVTFNLQVYSITKTQHAHLHSRFKTPILKNTLNRKSHIDSSSTQGSTHHKGHANLEVRDAHNDRRLGFVLNLAKNLRDRARRNAAVLVVLRGARHCERLARARLSIGEDRAIVALENALHNVGGDDVVRGLLTRVVQDVIEFERPVLLLVVDCAAVRVLGVVDAHCLCEVVIVGNTRDTDGARISVHARVAKNTDAVGEAKKKFEQRVG